MNAQMIEWAKEEEENRKATERARNEEKALREKLERKSREVEDWKAAIWMNRESVCDENVKIHGLERRMENHRGFVGHLLRSTSGQSRSDMSDEHKDLLKTSSLWHAEEIQRNTKELSYYKGTREALEKERTIMEGEMMLKKREKESLEEEMEENRKKMEYLEDVGKVIRSKQSALYEQWTKSNKIR